MITHSYRSIRKYFLCCFSVVLLLFFHIKVLAQAEFKKNFPLKKCAKLSTDSLFFGVKLDIGKDSTQCFTVTNCGDTLESVYADLRAASYSLTFPYVPNLKPDSTFTFCVTYQPQKYSIIPDSIVVSPGGTIRLLGSTPCAHVFATPAVVSFGTVPVGKLALDTILLTNDGDLPFIQNGVYFSTYYFRLIGFNRFDTIPPHQSVSLILAYQPVKEETDSGTVHFTSKSDCGNTFNISLRGQGVFDGVDAITANEFFLSQNFPTPFSKGTSFTYSIPIESNIHIMISDMTGNLVRTIISGKVSAGEHFVHFDSNNLPTGFYILALESGSIKLTRDLILLN